MLQKISLCCIIAATLSLSAIAQDSLTTAPKSTLTISGYGDVYYRYDIIGKNKSNNLTSFTNSHNSFELGMASLKAEFNIKGVSIVADLGFGKRATEFSYNETGVLAAIKQLYISYQPKKWLKITAGSWATHIGYEVVDPHLNKNYSMSYMFSYGPFFHTGLKAEFYKGIHSVMLGVANSTDFKYAPINGNNKFVLAQYAIAINSHLSAYLNYVGGRSVDSFLTNQIDLVLVSNVNDMFSLGFNSTVSLVNKKQLETNLKNTNPWYGAALYATVTPKPWVSISARAEYFDDQYHLKVMKPFTHNGGNVFDATLSANFKTHGLTFIPEIRYDGSNRSIFTDKNGNAVNHSVSFLVAAIYNFSYQPKIHK